MAKFEFVSRDVEIEICGKIYNVTLDNNTLKLCENIQKKAGEMAKKVFVDNSTVSNKKVCDFFLESIEKFLGEGSTTEIFIGREKNLLDAAHLFNFIISELAANFRNETNLLGMSE